MLGQEGREVLTSLERKYGKLLSEWKIRGIIWWDSEMKGVVEEKLNDRREKNDAWVIINRQ